MNKRIYATRAHWSDTLQKWIFEQGWTRSFRGSAIEAYHPFDVETFAELREPPGYFKKEVKQSSEMNMNKPPGRLRGSRNADETRLVNTTAAFPLMRTQSPFAGSYSILLPKGPCV